MITRQCTTGGWRDSAAGPLVRPYAMTRGRTRADEIELHRTTLVVATGDPPRAAGPTPRHAAEPVPSDAADPTPDTADQTPDAADSAPPHAADSAPPHAADSAEWSADHERILRLCRKPASIGDLAAALEVPVMVATVLVADLLHSGELAVPLAPTREPDQALLQAVLDGIRRL
ncbi:DUF742 domain-containing protein [Saccharopolyspora sp. HNM0986]|uniref:DUF742 domain-containing protein n=1 Tax=Saccharopolyspora galaxeae TaxID=2781241 RepID=UPI00190CFE27|nr:DUF742 domain-containing protein [Saccharopolyspora sp. HNM0986]MBK0870616.1 DUF742 domain-containing protein [Saccharopolyspora sp. HNM0986]